MFRHEIRRALPAIVTLAFLILVAALASAADSTPLPEKRFTIQTATYVPRSLAERHLQRVANVFAETDRGDLRIEDTGDYYAVRVGSFRVFAEAEAARDAVRSLARDAFILNEDPDTDARIVLLYPDLSPGSGPFRIQAGTFSAPGEARELFDRLAGKVGEEMASRLRIEKQGEAYFVRLVGFESLTEARRARRDLRNADEGAVLQRQDPREETEIVFGSDAATPTVRVSSRTTRLEVARKKPPDEPTTDRPSTSPPRFSPERQVRTFEEIDREMANLMDKREYGKAISLIKGAIEQWPDNPELHAWYGNALLSMDRPDKAVASFRKAAELAPAVTEYQSDLGHSLMYVHMDTAREAIRVFQKALALDPQNSDALEGLGTVYVSIGQPDKAEEIYRNLREIDPDAATRLDNALRYGINWSR